MEWRNNNEFRNNNGPPSVGSPIMPSLFMGPLNYTQILGVKYSLNISPNQLGRQISKNILCSISSAAFLFVDVVTLQSIKLNLLDSVHSVYKIGIHRGKFQRYV